MHNRILLLTNHPNRNINGIFNIMTGTQIEYINHPNSNRNGINDAYGIATRTLNDYQDYTALYVRLVGHEPPSITNARDHELESHSKHMN